MKEMIAKFVADLEKEIANLEARRASEVERGQRMLAEGLGSGRHLGHNLGNVANEISEFAAKIEQTQMILADLRNRVAFAEEK